ncbi:MAG: PD-(D/E)XK nuclease family protein [Acidimicrobiia bacterium]|nr:PD-(D/E)XK nuclease family protein [Acidimicrobiia bacterium]
MSLTADRVTPGAALGALAAAIGKAKAGDLLAPVTVVVPTNACGVMARRALGRDGGVVGIDMVTLNRLAELIAGPALAAAGRSPISAPVIDLAAAKVLADHPGSYAQVAEHPSTIVALREVHNEIRLAGADAAAALAAASRRGAETVRVSNAVDDLLSGDWYDEADLFSGAMSAVGHGVPRGLAHVVLHLPTDLSGRALAFVRALAEQIDVHALVEMCGDPEVDADADALLERLGVVGTTAGPSSAPPSNSPPGPPRIVSTTDADDEVRIAVRTVVDAARGGTPLERIAVLWPVNAPYARLVEHHLDAADIGWNGRPGTLLSEQLVCRLLLDLLDIDHRGLRRRDLFALLADVPARDGSGQFLPSAAWERVSREAGVARDSDWTPRLAAYADHERWGDAATGLSSFVAELRRALGHRDAPRRWWDWADWCIEQLERWIGRATLERLPEAEYAAWESLTAAIDRLRHLDQVGDPVNRHRFRSTLAAELDTAPPRRGRIGGGVSVGPLEGAVGFDIDVAVVLGAAEGSLPPVPRSDPLLSDADRAAAGLPGSDARTIRLHRRLLALLATSDTTITTPRGDLRTTAIREPSRWITGTADPADHRTVQTVKSHAAGLAHTTFPTSASEHRLRTRRAHTLGGGAVRDSPGARDDTVLQRAALLVAARASASLTGYDGNLSSIDVPPLDHAVSPSRLERWTKCPHAYFMRDLLRLHPIEEPDDEISITALERGSLHHDVLDLFHRAVIAGELPQPDGQGWGDLHRTALLGFFRDVCARSERRGRTGRPASWADERSRMQADLLRWLELDGDRARSRGARVIASEYRFETDEHVRLALTDGRSLTLTGSVDRIDRGDGGVLYVTDHKTGKDNYRQLDADDPTLGGSAFQLPSYAAAARALTGEPDARVEAEYSLLEKGAYARRGYELTDAVWDRVAIAATVVVEGIESGYFPNRPARPGFRMYPDCEYCEPDHLGTALRWGEWSRKRHDPALARWFSPDDAEAAEPDGVAT